MDNGVTFEVELLQEIINSPTNRHKAYKLIILIFKLFSISENQQAIKSVFASYNFLSDWSYSFLSFLDNLAISAFK